jgi:hypothetical protein
VGELVVSRRVVTAILWLFSPVTDAVRFEGSRSTYEEHSVEKQFGSEF